MHHPREWFTGLLIGLLLSSPMIFADLSVLPTGTGADAIESHHFPNRIHEFVWRNWNVVPPVKIASILDASEAEVTEMAVSMGLPAVATVPPEMMTRGYVSIIRRNWHLLPYAQLVELMEMTPERLDEMLREEDFLWIKLGRTKPASKPLRYQPPSESAMKHAAQIRMVVEKDFGASITEPGELRFDFVKQLSKPIPNFSLPLKTDDEIPFQRIVHSYVAVFGDPLLNADLDPYPDGFLQRLASTGVNGVWLQAVLRDMAPGGQSFPEFGDDHEIRLANLRTLVDRAKKSGIDIYLYINEPRGMPLSFFNDRPEMAGVKSGELTALCTSVPEVRQWMSDTLAHIFKEVPGLGGIYAISASENLTNCASHGGWKECPRCKERSDADILVEVVTVLEEGVHRGNPDAKVLISDWGWRGHGDAQDIIARLPQSVWLMSVSEWQLPIERGGVKSIVGEYSISSVGPGPRALPHWKVAEDRKLKTGTEIQFNNTCEIATIPYLPVMDLVAEHCNNLLTQANLDAMFIGWTMGGHPSPNIELAKRLSLTPAPKVDDVLNAIATERYGTEGAPHARRAWTLMSDSFREYPFHISVVYTCPVQWGSANPLYIEKTGYSASMWGFPYDDLKGWRGPYPEDIFANQFEKIVQGWKPGIEALQRAVDLSPKGKRANAETDLRYAKAAANHFQAVANQSRFVAARDALADPAQTLSPEERTQLITQIKQSIESEIILAQELYTLVKEDSRIGFEPSCQYFYLPLDLVEKVVNCRWLLKNLNQFPGYPSTSLSKENQTLASINSLHSTK